MKTNNSNTYMLRPASWRCYERERKRDMVQILFSRVGGVLLTRRTEGRWR